MGVMHCDQAQPGAWQSRGACERARTRGLLRFQSQPDTQLAADLLRPAKGRRGLTIAGTFSGITVIKGELAEEEHSAAEP